MNTDACLVCSTAAQNVNTHGGDYTHQRCPRCGEFKISGSAKVTLEKYSGERFKVSGWINEQNRLGYVPLISSEDIQRVMTFPIPTIVERANRIILYGGKIVSSMNASFDISNPGLIAITYCKNDKEVVFLADFLRERGLLKRKNAQAETYLTVEGFAKYEELSARHPGSTQAFVAMWFDNSMRETYSSGFAIGIRDAGYDPVRVDSVEHVGKIDDEIIAQIRKSRFVVADFTGSRGGVYFEAGFALGLNLPVFWTCRNTEIKDLHFDIRQFNCIDWENPEELADRLQRRIEAVIGRGPRAAG